MERGGTTLDLSGPEMVACLAVGECWPDVSSPLLVSLEEVMYDTEGKGRQPTGEELAGLREKGLVSREDPPRLNEGLQRALWVLADPTVKIGACFGNADTLGAGGYYARRNGREDELVMYLRQESGNHLLSFFHSPRSLAEAADRQVGFAPVSHVPQFALEASFKEYVVLLALMDARRTRYLEAMLQRRPAGPDEFIAEAVRPMLDRSETHHDIRWLVPLLQITAPIPAQVADEEIAPLLERLASRGYLQPGDTIPGAYRFHPQLEDLVGSFLTLVSFFYLGLARLQPSEEAWETTNFAAFRSLDTLWVVDYLDLQAADPRVQVFASSDLDLRQALAALLSESGLGGQKCPACGSALVAEEVCLQCGARVPRPAPAAPAAAPAPATPAPQAVAAGPLPQAVPAGPPPQAGPVCPSCGAVLAPAARFCNHCGAQISAPPAPACRACGAPMAPGQRFCTRCGAQVG